MADRRALGELEELIERVKPDVVHTHSSKAGILGRIAAWNVLKRGARVGILHTIHGPPFMPIEGGVLSRVKTLGLNFGYTLAERHAAKRCHVIFSVADAMTRQFLARGIGRAEQYVTVYSGMETRAFLEPTLGQDRARIRRKLGLRDSDFVVGTVARLAQHKGHDDLLEALGDVLRERTHMKLLWVGDGWWRERLVARAKGVGLSVAQLDAHSEADRDPAETANIILTGLVPPERVPGLVRAMDVLAHPSSREGLPRTVPQALLCGVCPVAYDVDGTGEICREMQTGRLVKLGDIRGLREAVLWLSEHPMERAEMARAGREECAEKFSTERMVQELEKVYARAAEMSRGGAG